MVVFIQESHSIATELGHSKPLKYFIRLLSVVMEGAIEGSRIEVGGR